jgi:DNA polymerase I-like protein with 3'-5' exonuclease and polymerase domains
VKHPVAKAYLEYDRLRSELLTLRQRRKHVWVTDAIHPTFNLPGANTGRITVSDPAMQNVPTDPESRGMYRAPAGMVFVQGDLSRIEFAQAQFSGDTAMIAAFNLPKSDPRGDLYAITGIFALPLEEVAGDDKHPAYKLGKRVNLAFCYGMQAQEFQNRTRDSAGKPYTPEEAIAFRQAYFDLYPAWQRGLRARGMLPEQARLLKVAPS